MQSNHKQNTLFSQFIRYVSLNALGMLGLSCYILADTFFIARELGTDGLTALNLAIPIYSFINGFGLMVGMGGGTRYAIYKGSGEKRKGNDVFTQVTLFALLISLMGVFMGLFFAPSLSTILGADHVIHQMTTTYLRIMLLFSPFFILNNVLLCFVRNDGAPNTSMLGMLLGSISNIILDYIFMVPLKMGMFGAVLATGIAPIISILILSSHFIRKRNHFKLIKPRLQLRRIFDVCSIGASSMVGELSSGVVMIIFNSIILRLEGNIGVAAYGVIANISLVVIALFNGIAGGIQPILSNNYGKGKIKNVYKIYRYALITSILLAITTYGITYLYAESIVGLFNIEGNIQLISIATNGFKLYFMAFIFVGFNVITSIYFSSIGNPLPSFLVSILRGFVIIVPITFILSSLLHMTGVWLSFTIAEVITAIFAIYCIYKHRLTNNAGI